MSITTPSPTQQQILDVAVQLFAEKGFAGTTLRNVVNAAKVNLGSVHYHFGSKEDLFRAVVARIAEPVVQRQQEALAQLEMTGEPLTVEGVLRAFLAPPLQYVNQDQSRLVCAQFM
ncbi:MAG: TetR/AcrR family transcriptional regulator, partial [Kamptonema sp. SIO4C4]|nr:TetR/AcrR family transcriptional regulator [Kamptonema sp. SIO4C4]